MWPEILARVPDATLEIFYGFDTWEKTGGGAQTVAENAPLKLKNMMCRFDSVYNRGRVSQEKLAEEMLSAGVWLYPTWFHETSCITAMEAQAAGLRIVTSPIGALPETAPHATFIEGDWLSQDYQEHFTFEAVNATLRDDDDRKVNPTWFDWDIIAAEWIDMFTNIERDMMPKYQGFKCE
jgi:glycosyltransferase involved in cell wall biosynthesis